jgi:hypothetical protein
MNRMKNALHHRLAVLVVAAGILSGGKAFAFGDECFTYGYIGILQCTTAQIPANPSTHTITMKIHSAWTTYQLTDKGNGNIIRSGRTGGGWHYETIGGLYNTAQGYQLYCNSFTGDCELNNS